MHSTMHCMAWAYRQGGEHGILRGVGSLMVAQLIGAPELVLLLGRSELDMGLGVVVGHPQDHEATVTNVGAGQAAMHGVQQHDAACAAALCAGCCHSGGCCLHDCTPNTQHSKLAETRKYS